MLALMLHNIALNDLQGHVAATVYSWGGDRPPSLPEHPDIVLAGESNVYLLLKNGRVAEI